MTSLSNHPPACAQGPQPDLVDGLRQADSPAVRDYPRDGCVHHLVEEQARRTPDALAIVDDAYEISYAELNVRANQLARYLRGQGAGPQKPVALLLPRGPELAACALAILKAGAACVPLDASLPSERIDKMLQLSDASLIVANSGMRLSTEIALSRIDIDADWPRIDRESEDNVDAPVCGDDLCYIIFTSGSTGEPKGVAMPHRALVNLAWWHLYAPQAPGAVPGGASVPARTLQFAPIGFDVSFQEIFATWASGGALVPVPDEVRRDPDALLSSIAKFSVERLYLPVVMLHQLALACASGAPPPATLRDVVTAGEALHITPAVTQLFASLPDCRLHNHYGPSETHVTTAYVLEGPPARWPAFPPIGRPIWNVRTYVLDQDMKPCADSREGELYLAGDCLAQGYAGRPDLTAERFLPVSLPEESMENREDGGSTPAVRMYKTGDLVRVNAAGDLEYLGRADQQLKINGFRIESGEIEQVLAAHPLVRQAAVVEREFDDGDKALAAFYISRNESEIAASELRTHLNASLPAYMIPAAFYPLDELPLTASGKVDRRALRQIAVRQTEPSSAVASSSEDVDHLVARAWAEVLHLASPGWNDNFFEVGGNSIRAVTLHRRLKNLLKIEFPITILFQFPTITSLASSIRRDWTPSRHSGGNGASTSRNAAAQFKQLKSYRRI